MVEYTPDQVKFVEEFSNTRDRLSLEVGLLTQEKETLLFANTTLAENNAALQSSIDDMHSNVARESFEESEKLSKLREEVNRLTADIEVLKTRREVMAKDLDEKNNTLINLGVLIKSIQIATQDTTDHIRKISNELNVYTGRIESSALNIEHESNRVKSFTDELGNVVDAERKANYEKSREIDNRELAVINREKMVELQYSKAVKGIK
jgi:uncharacterized protein YoxC